MPSNMLRSTMALFAAGLSLQPVVAQAALPGNSVGSQLTAPNIIVGRSQFLFPGRGSEFLGSSNGLQFFVQNDCNLVVYGADGRPNWAFEAGPPDYFATDCWLEFDPQQGGTLLFKLRVGATGQIVTRWNSMVGGNGATLVMQTDGNLVIYQGGVARWWLTQPNSHFRRLR